MERTKMKLPLAVLAISSTCLLLDPSPGFAQQQGGTSGASTNTRSRQTQPSGASTNTSSRRTQPFQPFFPPPRPTIRILAAPNVQSSQDSRQDWTPIGHAVAALSVVPPDLCAR